ncbi:HVO_A0114 family putative DNA-binding protein [Halorhabdus salina]|uniref:HVO_A0114 family putative DNA-binding protein n=1 Tax=Halorhabdus salina TaxID=2750670 RepID=UPI0015EF2EA9|nr:transcriptional regulator [Halorhabdus salina]
MVTTGNEEYHSVRTLHVRFREGDDEALEDALDALDRGESPDSHLEVVYHDPADIHQVTRPKTLTLLRTIVQHEPSSIRETARLVDRDVSQVHRNLQELADLHLVELIDDGNAKRPSVWYDAIDIDLPLTQSAIDSENVRA